jgi:HD-GYP domain-containing protein (c-di-GMP phosphodiesterase class II)
MMTSAEAPSPLALLLELGQAFHSTLELDPLLVSILKQIQSAVRSESGSIWLMDEAQQALTCTHAVGPHADDLIGRQFSAEKFLWIYSAASGRAIKVDDVAGDKEWVTHFSEYIRPETRSLILAPLEARGDLLGAVSVVNKLGQAAFTGMDLELLTALSGHAAVAIQNAQLYDQHRRSAERQSLLEEISRYLQQTLDLDVLIPRIFETVNKAIQAEAQSIWLLNTEAGTLTCRFATGPGADEIKKVTVPLGVQSIVGTCVVKQESIIIADAQKDPRFFRGADEKTGLITRSLMSVPMVREGKSIGAIQAINKRNGALFTRDDLDLFRSIADSAALAIENARLYAELEVSYDATLEALTMALDLRDRETEGHSRRVVEYTARLARQIGLDKDTIDEFRRGALIHDVGKIGVPDAVLHKPGPLDPDERKIIEKHPQAGYEMLLGIPYLTDEIKIVLAHQEKWDGTGYPLGLKGEAIPLGARLFMIADTFDALTSDRPYRKGKPYEVAREIIAAESGRQFDPQAVEAFLAVPPEEWAQIRAMVMVEVARRRAQHAEKVMKGHTGMLSPDRVKDPPQPRNPGAA